MTTTSNTTWDTAEGVRQLAEEVGRDPVEMALDQVALYRRALSQTRQSLEALKDKLLQYEVL